MQIISFGYKSSLPPHGTSELWDVRSMRNPHALPSLRELDGRTDEVQQYVRTDPKFKSIFDAALAHRHPFAVLAFGCYGGRHRSVAMAELVAKELRKGGIEVEVKHLALGVTS
jgi:UPF0042 nucleotide-binding protein